jgi:hypothetical protein
MTYLFAACSLVLTFVVLGAGCSREVCGAGEVCSCKDGTEPVLHCDNSPPVNCAEACADHGGVKPDEFDAGDGG